MILDCVAFSFVFIIVSIFFFFMQKTAYEMRICDWSSDVCSSDLLAEHWDEILADIDSLVSIESVNDPETASPGAPFGAGPRAALDRFLAMAQGYGFDVTDLDGYVGFCDLPARDSAQRSAERRVGQECVVTCECGWLPYK